LKNYREILLRTSAYKRKYLNTSQVEGSKSFKYQHIIKHLFKPKTHLIGKGLLTTKPYSKEDRGFKYWDDPNELIERLRLLLASESAENTNHKIEIALHCSLEKQIYNKMNQINKFGESSSRSNSGSGIVASLKIYILNRQEKRILI